LRTVAEWYAGFLPLTLAVETPYEPVTVASEGPAEILGHRDIENVIPARRQLNLFVNNIHGRAMCTRNKICVHRESLE